MPILNLMANQFQVLRYLHGYQYSGYDIYYDIYYIYEVKYVSNRRSFNGAGLRTCPC